LRVSKATIFIVNAESVLPANIILPSDFRQNYSTLPCLFIGFMGFMTISELHDGHIKISQPVQAKQLLQVLSTSILEN